MLEAIGAGSRRQIGNRDWSELWTESEELIQVKREIEELKATGLSHPEVVSAEGRLECESVRFWLSRDELTRMDRCNVVDGPDQGRWQEDDTELLEEPRLRPHATPQPHLHRSLRHLDVPEPRKQSSRPSVSSLCYLLCVSSSLGNCVAVLTPHSPDLSFPQSSSVKSSRLSSWLAGSSPARARRRCTRRKSLPLHSLLQRFPTRSSVPSHSSSSCVSSPPRVSTD